MTPDPIDLEATGALAEAKATIRRAGQGDRRRTARVIHEPVNAWSTGQPPATPQEPDTYGPFFDPCDKCVTRTHCAHHDRCLAECVPADLRTSAPPAVWQDIETAPKDGTRVLVMWEYWSSEPFVAYFKECSDDGPTHWMPLPSPPTPGGTKP